MAENKAAKTFISGAMLLGVAGVFVKLLGMFFRIPLTNIITANGMGYYQTAYPVYTLMFTVSSTGIPTAISKMISERRSTGNYYEAYRVFKNAYKLMFSIGVVMCVLLFVFAPAITRYQMEPEAVHALRATAPALLFSPVLSCYRGYFQGNKNMAPTALSQVVEQVFRVGVGLMLAYLLIGKGLAFAAAGASFGASAGAFFGLVTMILIFHSRKKKIKEEIASGERSESHSDGRIIKDILKFSIPITIGACIMPILAWIDTMVVKRRLLSIGFDSVTARTLYGELSGMSTPIINVPQIITQSIALSMVPIISDAYKRDDMAFVRKNVNLGLRYALYIAFPAGTGLILLAKPIMRMFYSSEALAGSIDNAAACLQIYAVGMMFLAAVHALIGVLQGIGKQDIPVRNLLVGAIVKAIATYFLTGIPSINVRGAAVGTAIAYAVAAGLNLLAVKKYTGAKIEVNMVLIKPAIAAVIMGFAVFGATKLLSASFGSAITVGGSILIGAFVYAVMLLITGAIRGEDLEGISRLKKVAAILKKLHIVR